MSSLQISQGTFRLSDTKTLKIDHLSVAAGESWAFVGSNGSGKSALARALAGDLTLLSGQHESHFSRVTRLSFEQLQKLVSDEWQRNNTDLLSPGEEDTGRTTAEIIQDEVKDPARCARLAEQFGISALLDRRFKYLSTGETRKTLLCQALMTDPQLLILDEPFDGLDVNSRQQLAALLADLHSAGITLVLAVVLFLWPVQIMDLLSNKHELSVLGAPYLKLIGFSYVFNMLSSIYVSAMRSAENPGFGMKLFGVSTLLNTGMNYLLIFGKCGLPALGIQGAAIATLLSRVAEFLICLVCALRSRILPLDLAAFLRPGWEMLRRFVKYSTPVILNETAWGLGNSLLTVILGYTDNSVEMLAANAVMGNLNRLFLVVCFGLGAATAVMIGKAIGQGQSHREVMDLSRTLLVFTLLVGTGLAAVSLALVPTVFVPVVFPLFKLAGQSAAIAAALAVTSFVMIPLHAYSISAVTGVLRAGGDVACVLGHAGLLVV